MILDQDPALKPRMLMMPGQDPDILAARMPKHIQARYYSHALILICVTQLHRYDAQEWCEDENQNL